MSRFARNGAARIKRNRRGIKQVMRYLRGIEDMGLFFDSDISELGESTPPDSPSSFIDAKRVMDGDACPRRGESTPPPKYPVPEIKSAHSSQVRRGESTPPKPSNCSVKTGDCGVCGRGFCIRSLDRAVPDWTIAESYSNNAEILALHEATREAIWLRALRLSTPPHGLTYRIR
ncbi:hypothetical protein BDK51DRAFT_29550 [Blyttiomyces helicus]|uniref:Uncharacterized protein n=1 Tax=Blyttiomyces helicus TaxID=388810 RepID=A0A4P9WKK4_9FUNG|nr:hypothetical protein BDK51DRAFT_29550 [Blyttiomyces helicus]|eukprot:RKO92932.1 hypothetical protein BDK51DRAFT_29550 [Blyttiomyces helicus]